MALTVEAGGDDSEDDSQDKEYEARQPHEYLKYSIIYDYLKKNTGQDSDFKKVTEMGDFFFKRVWRTLGLK